jgi:hypothetical protein
MLNKITDGAILMRILLMRRARELHSLTYGDVACLGHTTIAKIFALESGMHENVDETNKILSRLERSLFLRDKKPARV